jgi:hypothetical protein
MTKRLQVILQDPEYREIQRAANAQRMTIAAWVRQALAMARRREPVGDSGKKLDVVRAATRHSYPTADIDTMLAEIEHGYGVAERR